MRGFFAKVFRILPAQAEFECWYGPRQTNRNIDIINTETATRETVIFFDIFPCVLYQIYWKFWNGQKMKVSTNHVKLPAESNFVFKFSHHHIASNTYVGPRTPTIPWIIIKPSADFWKSIVRFVEIRKRARTAFRWSLNTGTQWMPFTHYAFHYSWFHSIPP